MSNSFITIGDSKYFPSIALSALQAVRFHPECLFGIYDWGFTQGERNFFDSMPNIRVVDWKGRFSHRPFPDTYIKFIWRSTRAASGWKLKIKIFFKSAYELAFYGLRGKEWIFAQKPYCYAHWAKQPGIEKFIFLDGDAFLMAPVPELFEGDYDLGVTLRRPQEIVFTRGRCQVLNSGVVIFGSTADKHSMIIDSWIKSMATTSDECFMDQTSLTRLILGYEDLRSNMYGEILDVTTDGGVFKSKILDCETYNFNWIEEGVDPVKNKIVHFKGGRHSGQRFIELAKMLGLEKDVADVLHWHQS